MPFTRCSFHLLALTLAEKRALLNPPFALDGRNQGYSGARLSTGLRTCGARAPDVRTFGLLQRCPVGTSLIAIHCPPPWGREEREARVVGVTEIHYDAERQGRGRPPPRQPHPHGDSRHGPLYEDMPEKKVVPGTGLVWHQPHQGKDEDRNRVATGPNVYLFLAGKRSETVPFNPLYPLFTGLHRAEKRWFFGVFRPERGVTPLPRAPRNRES